MPKNYTIKPEYKKGEVSSWTLRFPNGVTWTMETEDEADLAGSLFQEADKNGITINHFQHIFPAILRMIGSKSMWSKI